MEYFAAARLCLSSLQWRSQILKIESSPGARAEVPQGRTNLQRRAAPTARDLKSSENGGR
jgi:hypothetical protein